MVVLLLNTGEKHLAHCESKEEQDYDSSPVITRGQRALEHIKRRLLPLEKMTHFGRILQFTISHSRVWPLYHSDTELASLVNVM